eukprot:gene13106-biopygen14215
MSLPTEPSLLPPHPHHEHETLIQRNLRLKVCAYCKRPGALLKCEGCRQRSYCDRKCQKRDWKQEHRGQCVELQQVFVPPALGWRGAAAGAGSFGGGGKAAAAAVDVDEDELENPCPICLDNEDDATVDGNHVGMCSACGQSYCGACNEGEERLAGRSPNCPTCRAPFRVSDEEEFKRCWKLEHDRSPGRHTPVAQNSLGFAYRNGKGVEQDHVEAAKWYRKSAEAGDAMAQCNLGNMHRSGEGVEKDHVEAVKWFRQSAETGVVEAQYNLGCMYDTGRGVEQDHVEATKWYRKAAEAGYAKAQYNLGIMYRNGKGVEQDHIEAAKWFRKSAMAGLADAQYNLGIMYRDGEGVEQNYVEAAKWYRKAAEAGDAIAQNNLGGVHIQGKGVEQDLVKGVKWTQLAAEQGFKDALFNLNNLQQANLIPTPPPGTAVTAILLTSANAAKYNNMTGRVVEPTEGVAIKPGRAAVLLDGEAAPISFKRMNVRVHP